MNDFKQYLIETRNEINAAITNFKTEELTKYQNNPLMTDNLFDFYHLMEGGKRVRGALVKLASNNHPDYLKVALAI